MGLDPRAPNAAVGVKPLKEDNKPEQNIVEGWAQGFNVGAVILLILLLLCNYRKGILLHKLILLEVSCPAAAIKGSIAAEIAESLTHLNS